MEVPSGTKLDRPKLTYMQGFGKAEPIRMMFAHSGVDFEDYQIPLSTWSKVKSQYPHNGMLPVLEVNKGQ